MVAPIERLKRRKEFLDVAASKINIAKPGLVLQARKLPSEIDKIRVGFTASRKVGNAVARNRARRRLKAVVKSALEPFAMSGYAYVIIARHATLNRPFDKLLRDMSSALIALKLKRPI